MRTQVLSHTRENPSLTEYLRLVPAGTRGCGPHWAAIPQKAALPSACVHWGGGWSPGVPGGRGGAGLSWAAFQLSQRKGPGPTVDAEQGIWRDRVTAKL